MRLLERAAGFLYSRLLETDNALTRLLVRRDVHVQRATFAATLLLYPAFCATSWITIVARQALGLKPRIVFAPTPILTIVESSELLRRLGYPSTTVVFATYHIRSDFDVNLQRAISNPAVGPWLPNLLHLWSLLRFDIFHFFFDGGLWSGMGVVPPARWLELPLLRLAGKRIVASAYGADVRIRHLNLMWQPFNICQECPAPGVYCICTPAGLVRTKYVRDWANVLVAMGDMGDFVPESRRDFKYWPIDVDRIAVRGGSAKGDPVRIVHSPNHPYFKGTRFLERAVVELRARGHDVELDLVQSVPNDEARRRYAEADIVFAQCLAGWMGYTELEGMAAGKPVIGYIRNPAYIDQTAGLPLVSATPLTLEQELETLVTDSSRREELGRLGRRYIEREWSYQALAPAYDSLHADVWERNDLARTLVRKWRDLVHGESGYRVGRPLYGPELREWIVYQDPRRQLDEFLRGFYGQPPPRPDELPRVHRDGRWIEDLTDIARYGLAAFHLGLIEPQIAEHQVRFATAARWVRDAFAAGKWAECHDQPPAVGLAVGVLLRAEAADPENGFRDAATGAAMLLRDTRLAVGKATVDELTGTITALFGLHEYSRVSRDRWAVESFERGAANICSALETNDAHIGEADLERRYLLVHQLDALHELTGVDDFRRWSCRLARRLYVQRVTAFVRLHEPI